MSLNASFESGFRQRSIGESVPPAKIDLQTGEVETQRGPTWLKSGDLPLAMLRLLFRAHQRAGVGGDGLPMQEVLNELYGDGVRHDPVAGNRRLHTLIGRVRLWSRTQDLEFSIHVERGALSLVWDPSRLEILPERAMEVIQPSGQITTAEKILRSAFGPGQWVGSSDVARILNVSIRTSNYRLKALCESGRLTADGKGPSRRYRFNRE
jgi:hypothetical protein